MCADWNQLFKDSIKIIRDPDPLVNEFIDELTAPAIAYDLGCGAGRHIIALAKSGMTIMTRCSAMTRAQLDALTL